MSVEYAAAVARAAEALRRVQDRLVGTEAPPDVLAKAAELLEQAVDQLDPFGLTLDHLPGWESRDRLRGTRTLLPPMEDAVWGHDEMHATITLGLFHLGGNGAAYGGSIPMLFDHVLGRLANTDRTISRTASLKVDYRRVTPVGRPLRVVGRFEREEGRKRFIRGELLDGDVLTAEVHGLFIALRPGQP